MDLQWINGNDDVAEMATKTNVNFNALQDGVSEEITEVKAYADAVSATTKTEAITEMQSWAKGVFSNRNLIINGDFKNTINQRGQSTYSEVSGTSFVYSVDRWNLWRSNITVTTNGISLSKNASASYGIFQTILEENYNGYEVTLSIKVDDIVYHVTEILSTTPENIQVNLPFGFIRTYISNGYTIVAVITTNNSTNLIEWVKLEHGSVATAIESEEDTINLLKCEPYYLPPISAYVSPVVMIATSATVMVGSLIFPVPMRIAPALVFPILAREIMTGNFVTITSCGYLGNQYGINALNGIVSDVPLTVGSWYSIQMGFDAEL